MKQTPKDPYDKQSKIKQPFEILANYDLQRIRPYATPGVRFKDGRPYLPEGRYTDASDFINTISKQR